MKELPLREILEKLDIDGIVRDGKWIRARCPFAELINPETGDTFHERGTDRNPSFFVSVSATELSGFGCFTCHQHGRVSSLVRKLERFRDEKYPGLAIEADLKETPDSYDDYEREIEMDIDPEPINKAAYLSLYPPAWSVLSARAYLTTRNISEGTAEFLQLQYDDEEMRVLFPVFDYTAQLFGFTGRSILPARQIEMVDKTRRQASGGGRGYPKVKDYYGLPKERLLLGEHLIQKGKPNWLIEGLFAYAHFIEIGAREICNPVASMGSRLTKYQRDLLISHNLPVYLGYDNDAAGERGIYGSEMDGAYYMLKDHVPTFVPLYPEGKNDPDDLTLVEVQEMLANPA